MLKWLVMPALIIFGTQAMPAPWPWHDKIAWISGLVFTSFLIWGVIVARSTLKRIARQADLLNRQNVVALASAKAAKERVVLMQSQTEILKESVAAAQCERG